MMIKKYRIKRETVVVTPDGFIQNLWAEITHKETLRWTTQRRDAALFVSRKDAEFTLEIISDISEYGHKIGDKEEKKRFLYHIQEIYVCV